MPNDKGVFPVSWQNKGFYGLNLLKFLQNTGMFRLNTLLLRCKHPEQNEGICLFLSLACLPIFVV